MAKKTQATAQAQATAKKAQATKDDAARIAAQRAFNDACKAAKDGKAAFYKMGAAFNRLFAVDGNGKAAYTYLAYKNTDDLAAAVGTTKSTACKAAKVAAAFADESGKVLAQYAAYSTDALYIMLTAATKDDKYAAATPRESVDKFITAKGITAATKRDDVAALAHGKTTGDGKAAKTTDDDKKAREKAARDYAAAAVTLRNILLSIGNDAAKDAFARMNAAVYAFDKAFSLAVDNRNTVDKARKTRDDAKQAAENARKAYDDAKQAAATAAENEKAAAAAVTAAKATGDDDEKTRVKKAYDDAKQAYAVAAKTAKAASDKAARAKKAAEKAQAAYDSAVKNVA